jgi:hypothetical protein
MSDPCERLGLVLDRATTRLQRRHTKGMGTSRDKRETQLYRDAMYLQDRLFVRWNACLQAPALKAIDDSWRQARQDLDMEGASDDELSRAVYRRLK